jgi:hypothetical protein
MTRAEHLRWAKDRALEYADRGDAGNAMSSLIQDLGAHPDTEHSVSVVSELMFPLVMGGHLVSRAELRKFIEGFQ